ncbi:MAG: response regulator, partial [Kiritimatiellaceae bacterium]|nr:response regulator [Kiritimatiellaceae bacterium]
PIDELLGKTDLDLFPEPLGRQLFEAEQQLMATGTTTRVREKHSHPDGTIQYIDAIKCPMRDKNQEIIGLAGISRDVTQQVENEFLLMAARTKAESAATAKSAFLADMSHEIRTPLNAVLGMTSLLSATPMNDEQHELVHVIHTSGEALLALINDVLDFSKIEAGALQQEMKPFKIRHCIANSLEIISTKAFEKSLDLVCCITGDVPESCVGDAPHLRQILLNLMSNATKFTDHGTIALHIAGTPLSRQEYRLDFSVTDTGIGMTQEVLGRIFKPFEQADASTKRIHGGTGLGLSISHRLVEMMGGILQVKSSVGVGSEFFFSITLHVPAGETPNPLRNQQNTLKGKRALIVTGNPTSLTIWERQLADWGITPIPFNNVSSVISCLNTLNPIDFAILDTMTPDINAALLTAELRKRPEFKNLPVVNLCEPRCTLLPSDPVIDAHLNKPVMPERLQEKLRLFLEKAEKPVVKIAPKIESTIIASNPLRILLAEDNPVNQKVAVKMLARLGYEVDVVENGLEAVNADQNKIYDLVFMDIQMPVMSGLEATKAILNRYPDGNGPKIVAMTAHALQECRQEGIDCGMTGYIVKPIRLEVLTEILSGIPRRSD